MRNPIAVATLLFTLTLPAGGHAGALTFENGPSKVPLLELFTSEGCSSCPPAERWMNKLIDDSRLWKEVVPIAFHVDYWDYIGWKDRFADPRFSVRQRQFASEGWISSVYTPGLVVGGREWRGWFRRPILELGKAPVVGRLRIEVTRETVDLHFAPTRAAPADPFDAHVAVLGFAVHTNVEAGENRGRRLEHNFVVLGYTRTQMVIEGESRVARLDRPKPRFDAPRLAVAAWINRRGDQRPVQSVGGWLPL